MNIRIHYLDGMRGWAALSVLLFHMFWETFGTLFPNFRLPILNFALNGKLAVYVFFILSGDALIAPYLASKNIKTIQELSFRRYFRISIPILLSCILCYFVLLLGINGNLNAAKILNRQDWLGTFVRFDPSLSDVIAYSLYDVYFNSRTPQSYNPFLWTMSIEMLGSLFVFIFAIQIDRLRRPELVSTIIAALLFLAKSYYCLFFIGVTFSILRNAGFFTKMHQKMFIFASWFLFLAVIFSCLRSEDIIADGHRTNMIRAIVLVFAIHGNPRLISTLESRLSKFLGRISFPLYLVHFCILISITSNAVIYLDSVHQLTEVTAFCVGISSVLASIMLAEAFSRVEQRALDLVYRVLKLSIIPK